MNTVLRRSIRSLKTGLLVSAVLGVNALSAGQFDGKTGVQLYSLRAQFIRYGVPDTLDKVKAFGVKEVELAGTYNLAPKDFLGQLEKRGLDPISGHFSFDMLRDDPESVAKEAKILGLDFVGCAWISHQGDFDEKECREAIRVFNKAGKVMAAHGMQFFYHPHGYEFQPHGNETLFDLLVEKTHKKNVALEMDVFWIIHPGQDPVEWLGKLKGRWQLMHLKDMRKGVSTGVLTGKSDVKNDVTLGSGQMNWPSILAAAKKAGVKHYFLEDESPISEQQIPASLAYLKKVSLTP